MDRKKAKEKGKYCEKLELEEKARYHDKISQFLNGFDPYELRDSEWSNDYNAIPPLDFPSLTSYLVCGISAYTLDEFRCYKSLKAHEQFTSGWVHDLMVFSPQNCENSVVKAKVLPSQRLNEKRHAPWVVLNQEGDILAAHCVCQAGLAESCTHVGALLFKIEAVVRIRQKTTVTGVPAYWMIPSNVDKVTPSVGHKLDYTSAAAKKKQLDKAINSGDAPAPVRKLRTCSVSDKCMSTPVPTPQRITDVFKALNDTGDRAVVLSSSLQYCNDFKDLVKPAVMPKSLRNMRNSKCDSMTVEELAEYCESVSDKAKVTDEEADKVERQTREQHKSPVWFSYRAGRITASKVHAVCRFRVDKPAVSTVRSVCYPGHTKVTVPAVTWGLQKEEEARAAYISHGRDSHFKFFAERSGFVINPDVPFMGASPDSVIFCDCCGKGCVEIKCPYKHRDTTVADACKDPDFCMEVKGGSFLLKKNHAYFSQVQCQMHVCKADYCDFVVWTEKDFSVIRIEPDEAFVAEMVEQSWNFFVKVVLPELVAKQFTTERPVTCLPKPPKRLALVPSPQKNQTPPDSKKPSSRAPRQKVKVWCVCRKPESGDMVACDNPQCKIEWYHVPCVGLEQLPEDDEAWFCSACL